MKNTTLRGLFAASLLLVSSNVFAQSAPESAEANSSATIVQKIEIETKGDLKFTTVAAGVSKTVSTLGAVSFGGNGIADGNEGAASFEVTKAANIPVLLTVSGLTELVGDDGNLATTYVVDAATVLTAAADASFASEGASRTLQLSASENSTLTGAGAIYVRIGGTVSPTSTQTPGLYSGTITLTAAYN